MNTYQTAERPDPCVRGEVVAHALRLYAQVAAQKEGRIVYLAGEAGCGRSATLNAVANAVRGDGRTAPVAHAAGVGQSGWS